METLYVVAFFVLLCMLVFVVFYLIDVLKNKNAEELEFRLAKAKLENTILQLEENPVVVANQENKENGFFVSKEELKGFEEEVKELSEDKKKYLQELVDYASTLDNTNSFQRKNYLTLTYGQRKAICKLIAQSGNLYAKFDFGKLVYEKGMEPLKLKSIKINIVDEESVRKAKEQMNANYAKQSGAIKISKGAKWLWFGLS